jgi:oligopeptide/dipeptide ABC transporter ATP-binding protein
VGEHKTLVTLKGNIPSIANPPSGCRFHTRCPEALDRCKQVEPKLINIRKDRFIACHLVVE